MAIVTVVTLFFLFYAGRTVAELSLLVLETILILAVLLLEGTLS